MEDQQIKLKRLLQKPELSITEMQWLLAYYEQTGDPGLKTFMDNQLLAETGNSVIPPDISQKLLKSIHEKLYLQSKQRKPPVFYIKPLIMAASLLGIFLSGYFILDTYRTHEVAKTENRRQFKNDVSPGGNKATLTLADGSVIVLDNTNNGALAKQGAANIIKLDGKLVYDPSAENTSQVVYNTIATPKGGQYQLELPDGSLVWLNASSSIHFPTSFVEKERRVTITGEAYFEVAKDAGKPFIVSVNNSEVQVLGTHFNINAYQDEDELRTTLLEGSVKFVDGNSTSLLEPGQQSQLSREGMVKIVSHVDLNEVVAWKNGHFRFDNAGIETIMRQLSRWYDVDIEYRGRTDDIFVAEMSRHIKLSDVLKALELTGRVQFDIDGKKIIVMP